MRTPTQENPLRILSLGAGVQSTTVLLMALDGYLPPLDAAVFADTHEEPAEVYRHLEWLMERCKLQGLPVFIVEEPKSVGLEIDLRDVLAGRRKRGIAQPPLHARGDFGSGRMIVRRQCTTWLKITPVRRKVRELAGLTKKRSPDYPLVVQVIGISWDESHRMKDTGESWIVNDYPLVDARTTRHDCKVWLDRMGYPEPPRSACVMCPLHNNADWRHLKLTDPDGWARALAYDELVRDAGDAFSVKGLEGQFFVHFSGTPLADVDLSTEEDHGQINLFGDECQGMCGV